MPADPLLVAALGAAPELGVIVVFAGLMFRFWKRHDEGLAAVQTRYTAELERINRDHDAELAELRGEIHALRGQLDEVNRKLDEERAARRAAEERSWRDHRGGIA